MLYHSHYLDKKTVAYFTEALNKLFSKTTGHSEIVVVCVGTNRYPGDSLGPMVGTRLAEQMKDQSCVHIYGTLEKPVHALNLQKTLSHIVRAHAHAYVIAVDACLGQFYKIGTIQLVEEPLKPGISMNKQLPPVGHVHMKGIINNHGPLNHKVLEHTSLTFVDEMSVVISRILLNSCQAIVPLLVQKPIISEHPTNQSSS